LNSPPPLFSFIPSPPIPGIVSTGLFSIYIHVYTVYSIHTIFALPHPFLTSSPFQ
jgi:hypothetical protein